MWSCLFSMHYYHKPKVECVVLCLAQNKMRYLTDMVLIFPWALQFQNLYPPHTHFHIKAYIVSYFVFFVNFFLLLLFIYPPFWFLYSFESSAIGPQDLHLRCQVCPQNHSVE